MTEVTTYGLCALWQELRGVICLVLGGTTQWALRSVVLLVLGPHWLAAV